MKIELRQLYLPCDPIVQPAFLRDDIVIHPRCGRTADYHHKFAPRRGPIIPEIFKSTDKLRLRSVQPRHLIYEYHDSLFRDRAEIVLELLKRLIPIARHRVEVSGALHEFPVPQIQFVPKFPLVLPRDKEVKPILKQVFYQIGFPDPSSAIHRNQFSLT